MKSYTLIALEPNAYEGILNNEESLAAQPLRVVVIEATGLLISGKEPQNANVKIVMHSGQAAIIAKMLEGLAKSIPLPDTQVNASSIPNSTEGE